MRTVRLSARLSERIVSAARDEYPYEACGFLFSGADEAEGPTRSVRSAEPAPNTSESERRRRFVISPEALRAAEARAGARGEVVTGFYHSHPDHPARPSSFDTEHAWPWYTYVIVGVEEGVATQIAAFELDDDAARFVACELSLPPEVGPAVAGR